MRLEVGLVRSSRVPVQCKRSSAIPRDERLSFQQNILQCAEEVRVTTTGQKARRWALGERSRPSMDPRVLRTDDEKKGTRLWQSKYFRPPFWASAWLSPDAWQASTYDLIDAEGLDSEALMNGTPSEREPSWIAATDSYHAPTGGMFTRVTSEELEPTFCKSRYAAIGAHCDGSFCDNYQLV